MKPINTAGADVTKPLLGAEPLSKEIKVISKVVTDSILGDMPLITKDGWVVVITGEGVVRSFGQVYGSKEEAAEVASNYLLNTRHPTTSVAWVQKLGRCLINRTVSSVEQTVTEVDSRFNAVVKVGW